MPHFPSLSSLFTHHQIHFLIQEFIHLFSPRTTSRLFLDDDDSLAYQITQLPPFDMLTSFNFIWLTRQLHFNRSFIGKRRHSTLWYSHFTIQLAAFYILNLMIIRTVFILTNPNSSQRLTVTILGSIFELVHTNRLHSEFAVLHYSLFAMAILLLISLNKKQSAFFKIIIIYCNQYLYVSQSTPKRQHHPQLNHYHTVYSSTIFPLTESERQSISRHGRAYLTFHPSITSFMTVNVALTATLIYLVVPPEENNLSWFSSPHLYWLHASLIIFMWSSWAFAVCYNMYYIFVYYLFADRILHTKHRKEVTAVRKITADNGMQRIGSTYFSALLMTHLIRADRLFNELAQLNSFWSLYLTVISLICSSLFCFTLFVSTLTWAVWFMKLFFISVSLPPICMLTISTWLAAKSFESMLKLYKAHSSVAAHSTRTVHYRMQIKLSNTLGHIASGRIGLSTKTGITIRNETIYQALTHTMMLFFLIANASRAS